MNSDFFCEAKDGQPTVKAHVLSKERVATRVYQCYVAAPLIQTKGLSKPESLVLERIAICVCAETRFINCGGSGAVSATRCGRELG